MGTDTRTHQHGNGARQKRSAAAAQGSGFNDANDDVVGDTVCEVTRTGGSFMLECMAHE